MIAESKYCSDVMKKHFDKELVLVMTKEDNGDFKSSTKCWICKSDCVVGDAEVRVHCDIAGNGRGTAQRDSNIHVKLNHKIPVEFHSLKNYDSILLCKN